MHQSIAQNVEILRRLRWRNFFRSAVVRPVLDLATRSEIIRYRKNKIWLACHAGILASETRHPCGRARADAETRIRRVTPIDVKFPNPHLIVETDRGRRFRRVAVISFDEVVWRSIWRRNLSVQSMRLL